MIAEATACAASPLASSLSGTNQRVSYILVRGKPHHYANYFDAHRDQGLIGASRDDEPKIIRALNCSRDEILTFEAAAEMRVVMAKVETWLSQQHSGVLGRDGERVKAEVRKILKRVTREVSDARHGEIDGDPT